MTEARTTLTRTEFAKLLGITPATVTTGIKRKSIVVDEDNRIDPEALPNLRYKVESEKRLAKKKARKTDEIKASSTRRYDYATEKLKVQTQLLEMKLLTDMGQLIPREQVTALFGAMYSAALNHFLSMADRVTPTVVAACNISDPEIMLAVKALLNKDVERSMQALKVVVEGVLDDGA